MINDPAASITKIASSQTYYTIRLLVDRDRLADAYRAYAYFRWLDDIMDLDADAGTAPAGRGESERRDLLERQKSLLENCYRGEAPRDANLQESMLVEIIQHDREENSGLQAYLRNMMQVMDFDAARRGTVVSQAELNEYTRWLSVSVTEAMHYFIGHDSFAPRDETRYLAVTAAHIAHMLRDTYDDVRAGYYNIPREVLEAGRIGPRDVDSDAYRGWIRSRVQLARGYFTAARKYFQRVRSFRCRVAGYTYTARFEWLLDTVEKEGFTLRPHYDERKGMGTGIRMGWLALSNMLGLRGAKTDPRPAVSRQQGKA
jgi:hypothetical protein